MSWNIFRRIPRERISSSESFLSLLRVIKVLVYILLFCGFLGCLVLSKGSLLLMTNTLSHLRTAEVDDDVPGNVQEVVRLQHLRCLIIGKHLH